MRNDLDEAATVKGEMGRRRRPARRAFFGDTLVAGGWSVLIKGPFVVSLGTCQDSAAEDFAIELIWIGM